MADTATESAIVDLGILSFAASPAWRFFPMNGRIVGRPTSGVGVMQIVRVWYRHCPDGLVAAWFAVGADRAKERSVVRSMNEGDRMIATVALPPPLV